MPQPFLELRAIGHALERIARRRRAQSVHTEAVDRDLCGRCASHRGEHRTTVAAKWLKQSRPTHWRSLQAFVFAAGIMGAVTPATETVHCRLFPGVSQSRP
ncbi:hypothetical protein, partial [Paraburkholderia hospita]